MEFDIGEILLCHHQHIAGIGQIDIAALFVERHILSFTAICSVGAKEVYIGGGFTVGSEDSEFVFQISPEVGCHLTDQWAVGG